MEMERINENTIRVLLENEDLTERGITVLDLLGNHKQIENFFYSILEEVDTDHQFQSNDAVTFQVLPNKNGLELFISKNGPDSEDAITTGDDGDIEEVADFIKRQLTSTDDHKATATADAGSDQATNEQPTAQELVLRLATFEDFIQLAHAAQLADGASSLYRYKDAFYLQLRFFKDEFDEDEIQDKFAVALEYGERAALSADVLSEYGKTIMAHDALAQAKHYFK
ncbi:adaptor protein MecA [Loigolactobacillus bifermentans]|uniref:Adapter protein MecA n=1 Tax=Loigolactobacillus bifermentans DSM 20003 TaxID=1423726 RepID=A0A0R1GN45_9LACO|nr:adaptor protein MecA [Loigolactobacillus bifermentans]KRK32746.1 adaptor protein [Loigolactobacillus bifermentans DSM 20003]QGG60049.1 adaptor protein MecA [Loigolactobacillus bifermentans]